MRRFLVRAFSYPKGGAGFEEYEDAIAWSRGARGRRTPRRYAVADGASESSFARLWAQLLTEAYAHGMLAPGTLRDDLARLAQRWQAYVNLRPLPWYGAEKARRGAFAAVVGLTLRHDSTWTALAVGDCCLVQVRAGGLERAFPITDPDDFGRRPFLLSSNLDRNVALEDAVSLADGEWQHGDTFLLMSDALAAYVLTAVTRGGCGVAEALAGFEHQSEFYAWAGKLRAAGTLRNDDCALLRVEVL
jgi:hypothetical protein